MPNDVLVKVENLHLVPATAADQETVNELRTDKTYRAKLTSATPRSVRQHNFYWACLDRAVENQFHYRSTAQLHLFVKHKLGLWDELTFHNGHVHIELRSESPMVMGADEFNGLLDQALVLICTEVCPGMDMRDLIRAAEETSGVVYASLRKQEAA